MASPAISREAVEAHELSRKLLLSKAKADVYSSAALYMVDLGEIVRKHETWCNLLPMVRPYYAVKCNSDPAILRTVKALGCGYDCASQSEIETVLSMGVDPQDIIYANPCKAVPYLRYAGSVGVQITTFDNESELYKIAKFMPKAKLILRILTDDSHSVCALGTKFGTALDQVAPLLHTAKSLNLDVIGVSFHVGSGCYSSESFRDAVFRAHGAFNIAKEVGYDLHFLDLGGGFPGTDEAAISFPEIAAVLREALSVHFPPHCGVTVVAEPGRYFASSCHKIAATIVSKRTVLPGKASAIANSSELQDSGIETASSDLEFVDYDAAESTGSLSLTVNEGQSDKPRFMYYTTDGVYGAFNCVLYDHALPRAQVFYRQPEGESSIVFPRHSLDRNSNELYESSIWGPTCDSMDCITKDARLPELDVGDWLLFEDMGAYTKAAATMFNGMPLAQSYYINTDTSNAAVAKALNGLGTAPLPLQGVLACE